MKLDARIPSGPIERRWENHRFEMKLINPANKRRYDVIVVATPLAVSGRILAQLAVLKPPGLIFDIGSLKTPLIDGLRELERAGCKVASVHPMYGPGTRLLSGRHLVVCDAGCPEQRGDDLQGGQNGVDVFLRYR